MIHNFAAIDLHVSMKSEPIFQVGDFAITNSLILGVVGVVLMLIVLFYVAGKVRRGGYNRFVGMIQWLFETLLNQADEIIGDRKVSRKVAPIAITMFFVIMFTYWLAIMPGVESIKVGHTPLFRELPSDLNFTFALAIITLVTAQVYAIKKHGFLGNIGRYVRNPLKDPIGAFEGLLEFIGEFSRHISLSLRLFGNAFAGAVLLMIAAALGQYFAFMILPFFMAFELFIGFIQAYVFFVLTLIFTSLAIADHGDHSQSESKMLKSES